MAIDRSETSRVLLRLLAETRPSEVAEVLRSMRDALPEHGEPPKADPGKLAADLCETRNRFLVQHRFEVGQLVQWKKGMKNRRRPQEGWPAIVMQVFPEPLFDTNPEESCAGTPYFREPLDIALGILDSDGDFLIFHYDSRRFEPFKAGTA